MGGELELQNIGSRYMYGGCLIEIVLDQKHGLYVGSIDGEHIGEQKLKRNVIASACEIIKTRMKEKEKETENENQ